MNKKPLGGNGAALPRVGFGALINTADAYGGGENGRRIGRALFGGGGVGATLV